jgi:hypothetical protein
MPLEQKPLEQMLLEQMPPEKMAWQGGQRKKSLEEMPLAEML